MPTVPFSFVPPSVLVSDNRCRILLIPDEVLTADISADTFATMLMSEGALAKSEAARLFGLTLVPLTEREIYDEAITQVMAAMRGSAGGQDGVADFRILDHGNATVAFKVSVPEGAPRSPGAPAGAFSFQSVRHIRVLRLGKQPRL